MVAQEKPSNHGGMSGSLVQRLAELNLIRDPATVGTKTLVITRPNQHFNQQEHVSPQGKC